MHDTRKGILRKLPDSAKSLWNRCSLPESRVVKVHADLLAFEALPIYIAITTPFTMGLREEAGGWQKNARLDP